MATKKAKTPLDDPAQSERFFQTAKESGTDASAFVRALKTILPKKRRVLRK